VPVSVIHNMYCKLINTMIDYQGSTISIKFDLQKLYLNVLYPIRESGLESKIYIVDYIAARIDKLERERRYCNRFIWDFIAYDRCRLALKIFDNDELVKSIAVDLTDSGYPVLSDPVKKRAPDFDGATLKMEFFGPPVDSDAKSNTLGRSGSPREDWFFPPSLAAAFHCISKMRRRLRGKEN
jgi:hypothetical protein